jgi:hypothetical protein
MARSTLCRVYRCSKDKVSSWALKKKITGWKRSAKRRQDLQDKISCLSCRLRSC